MSDSNETKPGEVSTDQLIELTACLERVRARAIVEAVEKVAGENDPATLKPFWSGWSSACEEAALRLKTEAWGMLPNGGWGPTGAANEDDRPSPEFPELLRRALSASSIGTSGDQAPGDATYVLRLLEAAGYIVPGKLAEAQEIAARFGASQPASPVAAAPIEALRRLESANDALCAMRTPEQYQSMIDAGQGDALIELDDARRDARTALAASQLVERKAQSVSDNGAWGECAHDWQRFYTGPVQTHVICAHCDLKQPSQAHGKSEAVAYPAMPQGYHPSQFNCDEFVWDADDMRAYADAAVALHADLPTEVDALRFELIDVTEERDSLRAQRPAAPAAGVAVVAVPAGFKLVPVEPTDAMLKVFADQAVGINAWDEATDAEKQEVRDMFSPAYAAMLAAAPDVAAIGEGAAHPDAARLDAVDAHSWLLEPDSTNDGCWTVYESGKSWIVTGKLSVRDAIDAALAQQAAPVAEGKQP